MYVHYCYAMLFLLSSTSTGSFTDRKPPTINSLCLLLLKPQHSYTFHMRRLREKIEPPQTLYCIFPPFHTFFFSFTNLSTLVTFMDEVTHIPRLGVYVTRDIDNSERSEVEELIEEGGVAAFSWGLHFHWVSFAILKEGRKEKKGVNLHQRQHKNVFPQNPARPTLQRYPPLSHTTTSSYPLAHSSPRSSSPLLY